MAGKLKFLAGFMAMLALACGWEPAALAQAGSCSQLASTLNSLDRNREYRDLDGNYEDARQLETNLQDLESQFVRGDCQRQLEETGQLDRQCRAVARRLTQARSAYDNLVADIETGRAVAEQRELTLQQIVRFGCDSGARSRVTVTNGRNNSPLRNLFEQLFGGEGNIVDESPFGFGGQSTLRTVCVRTCDGYYWPVSFSTTGDYLESDAQQCQAQCSGTEVNLYYYQNPGQNPEDMIDLAGQPYSTLPNAFRYRQEFDKSCTCRAQIDYGSITIDRTGDGTQSRARIDFKGQTFPMPLRDPRQTANAVVAEVVHVPLPRRRPARPGESPSFVTVATPAEIPETQTITFGKKQVRVVGPQTPFAQAGGAGT